MKLNSGLVTLAILCAVPAAVAADDKAWDSRFGALGLSGPVYAVKIEGGVVYASGAFTTAGGVGASRIAKWNNADWSALGDGVSGDVYAIATSGNDVYVGGVFTTAGGSGANHIARWNGSSWSTLGSGVSGDVRAIAIDGSDVYVGGTFTTAGGTTALRVARWNGSSWSPLGVGPSADVNAIRVAGSDVYVGGSFAAVSGMGASRIARWNGSTWSALGSGVSGTVNAIAIDGSDIYVGGAFTTAGGLSANRIARWNGSAWSALGSGLSGTVNAIAVDGSSVYVGGAFTTAGGLGAARVAMWDGGSWSSFGSGTSDVVNGIDVASGDLYVGGQFTVAGSKPSFYFGRYNPKIVPIFVTSFRAEADASGVRLWWDLFADEDVAEFRIYRRKKGDAVYERASANNPIPPNARTFVDTSIELGETYQYVLGVARPDGSEVRSAAAEVTTIAHVFFLRQNYPNPFNPTTTIAFTLPNKQHVALAVFDARGSNVRTLVDGTVEAGETEIRWDGKDGGGKPVSSGVYFYRLQAGTRVQTRKLVLIR